MLNKRLLVIEIGAILVAWLIFSWTWVSSALMAEWKPAQIIPSARAQFESCDPNNPCPTGWYCDTGTQTCKQLSDISLQHIQTTPTSFIGCNNRHEANVTVKIVNMPTGAYISSASYTLGNLTRNIDTSKCAVWDNKINCTIEIPALAECGEGQYTLTSNKIAFNLSIPDYAINETIYNISAGFSDISISSWICGDGQCQTELGEGPGNCCCDCPCSEGQYCDVKGGQKSTGICRSEPSSFSAVVIPPAKHNEAKFKITLSDAPSGVSLSISPGAISCVRAAGFPCQLQGVSITCGAGSVSENIYNANCTANYNIAEYSDEYDYSIAIRLNALANYKDCTTPKQKTFTSSIYFSLNKVYCGDGVVQENETSENCCYDVPCGGSQYCDITDYQISLLQSNQQKAGHYGPSFQNLCKNLDAFQVVNINATDAVALTQATAGYLTITPSFNVAIELTDVPNSTKEGITASCILGDALRNACTDRATCCQVLGCSRNGSIVTCKLQSMPILYNEIKGMLSGTPATTGVFSGNRINLTLSFNNGSQEISKTFNDGIFDINLTVVPDCGNGILEPELGESIDNCCQDAEAFGYMCPSGLTCVPEIGQCRNLSHVSGAIKLPANVACIHNFVEPATCSLNFSFNVTVLHPPDLKARIKDMEIKVIGDDKNDSLHVSRCYNISSTKTMTKFVCIARGEITESSTTKSTMTNYVQDKKYSTTTQKNRVFVGYTIKILADGSEITSKYENYTRNISFTVSFSEAVKQCWDYMEDTEEEMDKIDEKEDLFNAIFYMLTGISVIFFLVYIDTHIRWYLLASCAAAGLACVANFIKKFTIEADVKNFADDVYNRIYDKCGNVNYNEIEDDIEDLLDEISDMESKYNSMISTDTAGLLGMAMCTAFGICIAYMMMQPNPVAESGKIITIEIGGIKITGTPEAIKEFFKLVFELGKPPL
ncbi:MAG: hypothetical protein QXG26_02365 [Candidatus Aenigmatarchaeota archaeon]